jgi:transcriptional regulator with XRE-family HTH domain
MMTKMTWEDEARNFASMLNQLLAEKGMTQAELAKRAVVSTAYINRLCRGRAVPGWRTLRAIAAVLDVGIGNFDYDGQ